MLKRLRAPLVALAAVAAAGCTIQETPTPPLTGPSEYAISIGIEAQPDLLTRDGASNSTIVITARDPQGDPIRGLQLRLDIVVNAQLQDFGMLSTRTVFTNAEGRATAIYTAPPAPPTGASAVSDRVSIMASTVGTNQQNAKAHVVDIRLVLPVVNTPGAPVAFFTYAPSAGITPATNVSFNASGSYPVAGSRIVNYAWDWGDGTTDPINASPQEDHDWAGAGVYAVTLTVTDDLGQRASSTQLVTVN
jgi:hypothetical protein